MKTFKLLRSCKIYSRRLGNGSFMSCQAMRLSGIDRPDQKICFAIDPAICYIPAR
jgi:hypothetical protein